MQTVDIILLVFLAIGAFRGFQSGLLMQLLSLVAFLLAIIVGLHFMDYGAALLSDYFSGSEALMSVISFILIFFIVSISVNVVGKILKSILDMTLLGGFDNLGGAVTGVLKWGLVISVVIWALETFGDYPFDQFYENAAIFPVIAKIAPFIFESFAVTLPYFQEMTEPLKNYDQAWLLPYGNDHGLGNS